MAAKKETATATPAPAEAPAAQAQVSGQDGGAWPRPHQPTPANPHHCPRCTYFRLRERAADTGIERGICRRHAPRPGVENANPNASWPAVHSGDWCGEYVQVDD